MVLCPSEPPEKMLANCRRRPKPVALCAAVLAFSTSAVWSTPTTGIQNPMR